jgi:SAM-dependent methyltransferase
LPRRLTDTVRRTLAGAVTKRLAGRYFTPAELERADVNGRTLTIADATFRTRLGPPPRLDLVEPPDDEWLTGHLPNLKPADRVWEVAAFLKVRRLATPLEVIERARSGELYDENYYTKRGGGGPYVGYPASVMLDHDPWWEKLADEVVAGYSPKRALDLGCATGLLVRAFKQRGAGAAGIDISKWAIDNAVTGDVVQGSALELPYEDNSFDVIISQDFMEHIHPDDQARNLAEQIRVAQPGATLLHLIPFYDSDPPVQLDAHLCNATADWWQRLFEATPGLEVVSRPADTTPGSDATTLGQYFALRVTK